MSNAGFVSILLVGAAALALWVDVRLGSRSPASFKIVLLNGVAAFLALQLVGVTAQTLLSPDEPVQTIAVLFAIVLPLFVYVFLASLWFLKLIRDVAQIR
jgi:hypothetical protein